MRIAEFSESSKFWTHIALSGYAWKYACISVRTSNLPFFFCVVKIRDGRMWGVSLAPSSEEKTRVPLNVRSLFLVSKMKCDFRTQWSVWIALREWATSVRTLKEATSIGGMLGFGPTLQLTGCCFLFFPWGVPVLCGAMVWANGCCVVEFCCSWAPFMGKEGNTNLGQSCESFGSCRRFFNWTWYQVRLPAELKHINKRRKIN